MLAYKRIGVTVKSGLTQDDPTVSKVLGLLNDLGASVALDPTHLPVETESSDWRTDIDLLLVIGGDGTIIRAVRDVANCAVPVLSVNRGGVGFLAEMGSDEAESVLPGLLSGKGVIDERSVLCIEIYRNEKVVFQGLALNEVVLSQSSISRLLNLQVKVDSEPLTTYHSDGLIVATPTGSTAYSLSAGGPIVHPQLLAMILTPLNPHSFSQKPIVIPGASRIEVDILKRKSAHRDSDVSLTLDGQMYEPLEPLDSVHIYRNEETVKFVRRSKDTFYPTLRAKLKWGERLK